MVVNDSLGRAGFELDPSVLKTLVPLNCLLESHYQELLSHSEVIYAFKGDVIFEAGQYDSDDYFLLSGELDLTRAGADTEKLKGRASFGPVGEGQPRGSSAVICADATLLKVDRMRLDQLLSWSQSAEHLLVDISNRRDLDEDAAWLNTVLRSNLFLKVPPTNVERIFECLSSRTVEAGEVIIRQGELGDCCYFIKEGSALVSRQAADGKSSRAVAEIGAGRCFGEDALIQEQVRNATVTMTSGGVLLVLQKEDFLPLLREPPVSKFRFSFEAGKERARVLLDVRTDGEYSLGHLLCALNIPLHLLHLKARVLDKSIPYMMYCNSGARSVAAAHFLSGLGFDVVSMQGGLWSLDAQTRSQNTTTTDYILRDGSVTVGH